MEFFLIFFSLEIIKYILSSSIDRVQSTTLPQSRARDTHCLLRFNHRYITAFLCYERTHVLTTTTVLHNARKLKREYQFCFTFRRYIQTNGIIFIWVGVGAAPVSVWSTKH